MGNPPERPVLFLSGLSAHQLPQSHGCFADLAKIPESLAVFQQSRHQFNQITRPGAVIQLELQQLVPGGRTGAISLHFCPTMASWLLSELAFHYLDKPDVEQHSVATGAVLAHIAITTAYLTFLKNNKDGDVVGMATALGKSRSNVALTGPPSITGQMASIW